MNASWTKACTRLLLGVVVAALLGWWFGNAALGVGVFLVGAVLWQVFNLYQLERWLQDSGTPMPGAVGLWGRVIRRIAQQRRSFHTRNRQLLRLLGEYRSGTAAFPDGVVVLDRDKRIRWSNEAAVDLLGLDRRYDIGQRLDNLVRRPEFIRTLQSEGSTEPVVITAPGDAERAVSLQVASYGAGNRLVVVKDVTRQQITENARRDFIANASHELRSPLTVINGYLESIATDPDLPGQWRGPVQEMVRQSVRVGRLLEDLLELSRLESGDYEAQRVEIDMATLLGVVREEALALAGDPKHIALDVDCSINLLGDETEVHSVVYNLVANAVRYTGAGGHIEVRWQRDDDGASLVVSDDGIGIPEEEIPRITERFYRVDKGRSRHQGGTGLGLAIVRHALLRHGARMEVSSELGEGSRFTCRFPALRVVPVGEASVSAAG